MGVIILIFFCQCGQRLSYKNQLEIFIKEYITQWRHFYPSQALSAGDKEAAFAFEDFSSSQIRQWIQFNTSMLKKLELLESLQKISWDNRVDARLMRRQILSELERWERDRLHENSPGMYAELISQGVTDILARGLLDPEETSRALFLRLKGIEIICTTAAANLKNGSLYLTLDSLEGLKKSAEFYEKNLPGIVKKTLKPVKEETLLRKTRDSAAKIRQLATYIKEKVLPRRTLPDSLGKENYRRKLEIYTFSRMTPDLLESISLEEIEQVRQMMIMAASAYWERENPEQKKPENFKPVLDYALKAMEFHRVDNQQDFLHSFKNLIDQAEAFISQEEIVTLPEKRTLFTALSPQHFTGAAVGGVYPAGPFNPSADTLFYLPTVPDTAPLDVKEGFYRSFNHHFNTMIITHEIFPGHYLQLKLAASNPHKVRSLFPDDLYVEGWASLCEQITLDAGWDGNNPLTRLAHLRKRLENAVRAYTSVQVHCNGWDREQLTRFAVEKGLLAPQFAINLWDRIMRYPLQLTSYFLGFRYFSILLAKAKQRWGERFQMKDFCDKILHAGAVPLDELPGIL